MASRVKNCALRAKSKGRNSEAEEMYFVSISFTKLEIWLSIVCSRLLISLPAYYASFVSDSLSRRGGMHTPWTNLDLSSLCFEISRCDKELSLLGSRRIASYHSEQTYGDRTPHTLRNTVGSLVMTWLGPILASDPVPQLLLRPLQA